MTKRTIILTAVVILISAGLWAYTAIEPRQTNDAQKNATTSQSVDIPDTWESYENSTYNFSIAHPPEATVQAEGIDEKRYIKFMFLGSQQATGEIQDGFTLTISTYPKTASSEGLGEFVQAELEKYSETREVIQEPVSASFHGRPALTYKVETLGTTTITAVDRSDAFITISRNITDPRNTGYDEIVAGMLSTLAFQD